MAVIPSGGGGGGAGGGSGWIRITDINVPSGVADEKVYQDEADTVLQSCRVSDLDVEVSLKASYPLVLVNSVATQLAPAPDGGHYQGTVLATLAGAGVLQVKVVTPNGGDGAEDVATIAYEAPPQILTLEFTGAYPGVQTELKAGDTFQITGTTDVPADAVDIQDFGAMVAGLKTFVAGTSFLVMGTIANRGNASQLLSATARARSAITGAFGPVRDTNAGGAGVELINVLRCNNLHPTVLWGSVAYPFGQGALKGSEQATVAFSLANADTVSFTSPNGDLDVLNPTLNEDPKTVQRISGSYNDSTNNLRATAIRAANAAQTVANTLVKIANVATVINVTEPATRLRSGGNDGTAAQNHVITLTADQALYGAPSLEAAVGAGAWQGAGFAGGPKVWTRTLQVQDTDSKGTFAWTNLNGVNLAGIPTTVITGDANYVLGGFVARTITWDAFQTVSRNVNVVVADFAKLQAGLFSATNQQSVKWPIGTAPPKTDGYTVNAAGVSPHTVTWLDTAAAGSNSGEAYLSTYQEVV